MKIQSLKIKLDSDIKIIVKPTHAVLGKASIGLLKNNTCDVLETVSEKLSESDVIMIKPSIELVDKLFLVNYNFTPFDRMKNVGMEIIIFENDNVIHNKTFTQKHLSGYFIMFEIN